MTGVGKLEVVDFWLPTLPKKRFLKENEGVGERSVLFKDQLGVHK